MKKHLLSLLLLVAMVLPIPMLAQNYGHHIVANGTASNQYVPIYGRMCMYMQRTQSVYPASMLTSLQDGTITTLRYYMQTPASVVWSCPFQIKMGTISSTTLTSLASDADFTTVYTGMLDATDTVMTIELDVPFTYTGGNLVVEIANTATVPQMEIMSYNNNKFYGISQTGASWACTNNPTGQARAFLPKVDFLCENIACPKVSTIQVSQVP